MDRKLVVVKDGVILPELNYISGPIIAPTSIRTDVVGTMVKKGRTVFECDPADPANEEKRIKLDLGNYNSENFKKAEPAVKKIVPQKAVLASSPKPEEPVGVEETASLTDMVEKVEKELEVVEEKVEDETPTAKEDTNVDEGNVAEPSEEPSYENKGKKKKKR